MKYKPTVTEQYLRIVGVGACLETEVLCTEIECCWREIEHLENQLTEANEQDVTLDMLEIYAVAENTVRQEQEQSLDALLVEVAEWAREKFPEQSGESISVHMLREAEELREKPSDPIEMADVMMLVADLADFYKVDLKKAIREKLVICRKQEWGEADSEGVHEHIRGDDK